VLSLTLYFKVVHLYFINKKLVVNKDVRLYSINDSFQAPQIREKGSDDFVQQFCIGFILSLGHRIRSSHSIYDTIYKEDQKSYNSSRVNK
jgi:hypothetical protein